MKLPAIPEIAGIDEAVARILRPIKELLELRNGVLDSNGKNRHVTLADVEAIEKWQDATLVNSWVNYGTYANAGFYLDRGVVRLRGVIKSGAVPSVAFALPPGYRPEFTVLAAVVSNGAHGQVEINASGEVRPVSPSSTTQVSLDGIAFRAAT